MITSYRDNHLYIRSLVNNEIIYHYSLWSDDKIKGLTVSDDLKLIIFAYVSRHQRLYLQVREIATDKLINDFDNVCRNPSISLDPCSDIEMKISPDNSLVAIINKDKNGIITWNLETGELTSMLCTFNRYFSFIFSRTERALFVTYNYWLSKFTFEGKLLTVMDFKHLFEQGEVKLASMYDGSLLIVIEDYDSADVLVYKSPIISDEDQKSIQLLRKIEVKCPHLTPVITVAREEILIATLGNVLIYNTYSDKWLLTDFKYWLESEPIITRTGILHYEDHEYYQIYRRGPELDEDEPEPKKESTYPGRYQFFEKPSLLILLDKAFSLLPTIRTLKLLQEEYPLALPFDLFPLIIKELLKDEAIILNSEKLILFLVQYIRQPINKQLTKRFLTKEMMKQL